MARMCILVHNSTHSSHHFIVPLVVQKLYVMPLKTWWKAICINNYPVFRGVSKFWHLKIRPMFSLASLFHHTSQRYDLQSCRITSLSLLQSGPFRPVRFTNVPHGGNTACTNLPYKLQPNINRPFLTSTGRPMRFHSDRWELGSRTSSVCAVMEHNLSQHMDHPEHWGATVKLPSLHGSFLFVCLFVCLDVNWFREKNVQSLTYPLCVFYNFQAYFLMYSYFLSDNL